MRITDELDSTRVQLIPLGSNKKQVQIKLGPVIGTRIEAYAQYTLTRKVPVLIESAIKSVINDYAEESYM